MCEAHINEAVRNAFRVKKVTSSHTKKQTDILAEQELKDAVAIGHSKFWVLPGTEDIPFVQTWELVLKKRCVLTLIWVAGAAVTAGLVVLIF